MFEFGKSCENKSEGKFGLSIQVEPKSLYGFMLPLFTEFFVDKTAKGKSAEVILQMTSSHIQAQKIHTEN